MKLIFGAFQSRKKSLKCDVIDVRPLQILSKWGLLSDLGVVFWKLIFGSFQSRNKAVKCDVIDFRLLQIGIINRDDCNIST